MNTELTILIVVVVCAAIIFFAIKPSKKAEQQKQEFLKNQKEAEDNLKKSSQGLDYEMLKALNQINHNTKVLKNIQVFYLIISIIGTLILITNISKL